jgi:hypothetical protein
VATGDEEVEGYGVGFSEIEIKNGQYDNLGVNVLLVTQRGEVKETS